MENENREAYIEEMRKLAAEAREKLNTRQVGEYRTPASGLLDSNKVYITSAKSLNSASRYTKPENK